MVNNFEVWSLVTTGSSRTWKQLYCGEDFDKAVLTMELEKKKGAPCVRLEWR